MSIFTTFDILIMELWSVYAWLCGKDSVFGKFHFWDIVCEKYLDYGGFK